MAGAKQYKAEDFIKAIRGSGGIISTIASRMGCTWHTAKKYIVDMPTITQAYTDECESLLDLAEVKLIEAIRDGDLPSVKYYLSTKGKERGYYEKREVEADIPALEPLGAALARAVAQVYDEDEGEGEGES